MSKIKKMWVEKRDCNKEPLVKINPKSWSDMPKGIKMFIPTPKIVNQFVCNIPKGNFKNVKSLRRDMAVDFDAQMSCPMVTGISLRIISEASYEEHMLGIKKITPFWRVVEPSSKLAMKLACGIDYIIQRQENEGIDIQGLS